MSLLKGVEALGDVSSPLMDVTLISEPRGILINRLMWIIPSPRIGGRLVFAKGKATKEAVNLGGPYILGCS